jgi:transposase
MVINITMVWQRKIKKGNSLYVYEVTSRRDKNKKVVNDYVYLGKEIIENGKEKIIPPKHKNLNVRTTLEYGSVIALYKIGLNFGFEKIVDSIFKYKTNIDNFGKKVLILAINKILSGNGLEKFSSWFSETSLSTHTDLKSDDFTPKKIRSLHSNLAKSLPNNLALIEEKIASKIKKLYPEDIKHLVYDLSSIVFQGSNNELAEYGYTYKKNGNNRQINLALAVSKNFKLPIHHRILPGSIPSVLTVKNFTNELKNNNYVDLLCVIDRGFNSERNIHEILNAGLKVIGCVSSNLKIHKEVLSKCLNIENSQYFFKINKNILFYKEIFINNLKYIAFHSPKKAGTDNESFFDKIKELEDELNKLLDIKFKDENSLIEEMKNLCKTYYSYFIFTYNKNKKMTYKLNHVIISSRMNSFGKTVLFTNTNLKAEEVIQHYRDKDVIEKIFGLMKQSNLEPIYTTTEESTRVHFALLVYGYLFLALLNLKLNKLELSTGKILEELNKIREIVYSNNTTSLTEFTKTQRQIIEMLGL